jgi:hypothetical protein
MAKASIDHRTQIPEAVDLMLDAVARATGRDKAAISREVLIEWHRRKHREHMLYAKALSTNGMQMALDVIEPEEDGTARSARR